MTLWDLIRVGGFTTYILMLCSVISLSITVERCIYYHRRSKVKREIFMMLIYETLKDSGPEKTIEICKNTKSPFANIVYSGLNLQGFNEEVISNTMQRTITIETTKLERYINVVGTIGSTAVYIGLFGTVLGIIRAFSDIAHAGAGGINIVITGISEALVCTAIGLCVAIPAVMAYNYLLKKVEDQITDMELCASETMDLININPK